MSRSKNTHTANPFCMQKSSSRERVKEKRAGRRGQLTSVPRLLHHRHIRLHRSLRMRHPDTVLKSPNLVSFLWRRWRDRREEDVCLLSGLLRCEQETPALGAAARLHLLTHAAAGGLVRKVNTGREREKEREAERAREELRERRT